MNPYAFKRITDPEGRSNSGEPPEPFCKRYSRVFNEVEFNKLCLTDEEQDRSNYHYDKKARRNSHDTREESIF